MGGKSGGGQSTPYEAPNTLSSAQSLRIVDAISEGVIYGFANGNDAPLKSVYFDDTPVQNADGSFNFKGVAGFFQRGEQNQSYMPGFDSSERTVAVSASVKKTTPIVRTVTDSLVNRLRVTVGVERNAQVHGNGDIRPATTVMVIELVNAQGVQHSQLVTFTEKSSGSYYHDVLFDRLPQAPFNIRVRRQSDDSNSDKLSNNTFFASYVEIVDVKLSFPNTAVAAYSIDSDQFGNKVPRRNVLVKGLLVDVPSNYNPDTRAYSTPVWDGTFKKAWTNNPAWIFYDLCRQPRYSTLARRLKVADIDKWTLYEIGKYCDELVDDGFGGKEPRFVCNAYITDRRPAGELLSDLASVFTGMAMWNGHQLSVMMDVDSDPVAIYNNANVVNGEFTYSSAALKSIHTAVHVQYIDKNDGYRTKTEYLADDAAIARYGLNIKQVTAFGCDSRGQAARYGAWVLETELRQQHTVSFTVGREGLKHLPFDVVQVMDNQYAGAEVSGRIVAINGTAVTLDRDVDNAVGAMLHYTDADGFKSVKVTGQPSRNKLTLAAAVALSENDLWVLSAKVKPRLYRAISITENTDDGTYTVSAVLHDPKKYADVDTAANFDRNITSLHTLEPVLLNADVKTENGALVLTWDNLTVSGQVLSYDVKIYRNNKLFRHTPDATTPEIRLENLPNGDYRAEIRGRNARGVLSEPLVKAWSINYTVTGLRTTPKTLSIDLAWVVPTLDVSGLSSEVWYSRTNNIQTATKLTMLAYPQNAYTLTGVSVTDTFYFWVRMVDENGNAGEYTAAVEGRADNDPAPIVAQMQGAITKSALSQSLLEQLNSASSAATTLEGKVQAMHTMKVETISGGRSVIAGLALGADGATGDSQFLVYADKFGLVNPSSKAIDVPFAVTTKAGGLAQMALKGDFIATDSILARHIAAGQTITTPILSAPTINAGQLNSTTINNGNGNFTVDAAGNLYAKSGRFEGTVYADKIEGDVLKFIPFARVGIGRYALTYTNTSQKDIALSFQNISFMTPDSRSWSGGASYNYVQVKIKINEKVLYEQQFRSVFSHTEDGWRDSKEYVYKGLFYSVPFLYIAKGNTVSNIVVEIDDRRMRGFDLPSIPYILTARV